MRKSSDREGEGKAIRQARAAASGSAGEEERSSTRTYGVKNNSAGAIYHCNLRSNCKKLEKENRAGVMLTQGGIAV